MSKFRLNSLSINGYKNLKNQTRFDFSMCTDYTALIGLNGSGKSNILEAISLIYSALYHETKLDFRYRLEYSINNKKVVAENGKLKLEGGAKNLTKKEVPSYLPENVVACYSGEEMRLWDEIYLDSYADFFKDIKKSEGFVPKLLYINKYTWEIALLCLLCSDNPEIRKFITKTVGISYDEDVWVEVEIDDSRSKKYEDNEALSLVRRLSGLKKDSQDKEKRIHVNEIRTLELKAKDNMEFTRMLFYYLFITTMPERSEKVNTDKIITKLKLTFQQVDVPKLSEGEKKLILITCINKLLAGNKTLVLLDEPDAHIHIERKKLLKQFFNKNDHFTVLTTHSPSLLNSLDETNVFIIVNKEDGVHVIEADKQKHLSELTGGEFSLVDATIVASTSKDLLLVEGTNDYNYLKEALKRFSSDYTGFNFHIINCGGAGNVAAILEQSVIPILSEGQLCLCCFDDDDAGRKGKEKVDGLSQKLNKPQIQAITHPKIQGFPEGLKDFLMEDYFPVAAYSGIIANEISKKTKFRDYSQMPKAKTIIESKYRNFEDSAYANFKTFIDQLIQIQTDFHNPAS